KIFQVDLNGNVTEYKTGFTTATDILLTPNNKALITEFAEFSLTQPGFVPGTGRIVNEEGLTLLDELTMPTDLERSDDKTYYQLSYAEGTIQKLTFCSISKPHQQVPETTYIPHKTVSKLYSRAVDGV